LTSVTNWCAFFIALINAPSLYLAGGVRYDYRWK
jgi:hypothetical protein